MPSIMEAEKKGILGTDVVCQIGIVCHDLEKTGKAYAEFFGMECPPVSESGDPERVKAVFNGEPSDAACRMMFFELGNIQIELIQPDEKPSVWRNDLESKGEGLHHIAFIVKDMDGKLKKLDAMGIALRQKGDYANNSGCYAYVDARDTLKLTLELLENYAD